MTAEDSPADATGARPMADGTAARRWPIPALVCAVLLAVIHLAWLLAHFAPATMSPDANGYIVQARLLATEGRTSFSPTSPVQFVGMHWLETNDGVFHSRYPAGLPLLMAAAWKIGGLKAALLVNPLLASATVLLVFFLGRPLTGDAGALLAALVVAAIPVTNQHALDADAHIAATFFLVAGVIALRRFATTGASWAGFGAGALLGIIPTIRYPEAIAGVTIAVWLVWQVRPIWRAWPAAAGAIVPLGGLMVHNAVAYGAFWKTGYALTNEQTGFGIGYFTQHAIPYLQALGGQGLSLFFAFGAAGIAALAVERRRRSVGMLFAGLVVPLVLLYMAYYFGGGPGGTGGGAATGNLRFLIPTFPFFAVAGAWLLMRVANDLGVAGRVAVFVVALLQLIVSGSASFQGAAHTKTSLTAAARARMTAEKEIPPGSVLIADRTLAESLDAAGTWRLVEESFAAGMSPRGGPGGFMPPFGGPGGRENDPARPSPQQAGKNHAQQERYAGLSGNERHARAWSDIETWANGKPVYWFARSIDAAENALPANARAESVAEIDAPAMAGFGGPGGGAAGGMGGPGAGAPGGFGPGAGGGGRGARGGMRGGFGPPGGMSGGGRGGPGFGPGGFAGSEANAAPTKLRLVKIVWSKT